VFFSYLALVWCKRPESRRNICKLWGSPSVICRPELGWYDSILPCWCGCGCGCCVVLCVLLCVVLFIQSPFTSFVTLHASESCHDLYPTCGWSRVWSERMGGRRAVPCCAVPCREVDLVHCCSSAVTSCVLQWYCAWSEPSSRRLQSTWKFYSM
jgi:hypothetical protein